jgi:hypothetical protein
MVGVLEIGEPVEGWVKAERVGGLFDIGVGLNVG